MGGARCSRRGPARAASGAAAAEVSVRAATPSRAGDGPEPGYARADNRAPGWPAGGRGWKEGAGAGLRTPPARPRGARGGCASRQRSLRSAFRRRPSARPVWSPVFSPLPSPALPPSLRPALRAPRSGPRRRRPQPFIAAAASAGVAYWLRQPSPASSRRPTARQVEERARWPGLRTPRRHILGARVARFGPFCPHGSYFLRWRPFLGGLSAQKTGRVPLCPAPRAGGAKGRGGTDGSIVLPSGGAVHQEHCRGTSYLDFNEQMPGSPHLGGPYVVPRPREEGGGGWGPSQPAEGIGTLWILSRLGLKGVGNGHPTVQGHCSKGSEEVWGSGFQANSFGALQTQETIGPSRTP